MDLLINELKFILNKYNNQLIYSIFDLIQIEKKIKIKYIQKLNYNFKKTKKDTSILLILNSTDLEYIYICNQNKYNFDKLLSTFNDIKINEYSINNKLKIINNIREQLILKCKKIYINSNDSILKYLNIDELNNIIKTNSIHKFK